MRSSPDERTHHRCRHRAVVARVLRAQPGRPPGPVADRAGDARTHGYLPAAARRPLVTDAATGRLAAPGLGMAAPGGRRRAQCPAAPDLAVPAGANGVPLRLPRPVRRGADTAAHHADAPCIGWAGRGGSSGPVTDWSASSTVAQTPNIGGPNTQPPRSTVSFSKRSASVGGSTSARVLTPTRSINGTVAEITLAQAQAGASGPPWANVSTSTLGRARPAAANAVYRAGPICTAKPPFSSACTK